MRNDDIRRIINGNLTQNSIIELLKNNELNDKLLNILDNHPTKYAIKKLINENKTLNDIKNALSLPLKLDKAYDNNMLK